MNKHNIISIKTVMKDGKLVSKNKGQKSLMDSFLAELNEGQEVELFMEAAGENSTKLQRIKANTAIRELAKSQGYTFNEMKAIIKRNCGLYTHENHRIVFKSFLDCSKDEMIDVIEHIKEISGEFGNINFNQKL